MNRRKGTTKGVIDFPAAVSGVESEMQELHRLRGMMTAVDKKVMDKALEALDKDKAMSVWPKMLDILQQLENKYMDSKENEIDLNWDVIAVKEASA